MLRVQHQGYLPFTVPKTTYSTVGAACVFRLPGANTPRRSAHLTFHVYSGTAQVALDGNKDGPFIELTAGGAFDFPVATDALYIRGSGGSTEVAVVAALNPIEASL